jgi:hypothetical protein
MTERDWVKVSGSWVKTIQKAGVPTERAIGFAMWLEGSLVTELRWFAPRWSVLIAKRTEIAAPERVQILKRCLVDPEVRNAMETICTIMTDKIRIALALTQCYGSLNQCNH